MEVEDRPNDSLRYGGPRATMLPAFYITASLFRKVVFHIIPQLGRCVIQAIQGQGLLHG
jgi:hypothetical protein